MSYETIARYYDLVHANLTEDLPFLLRLAQQCGGDVLELGCGTGRVLLALADAGISTTGIDNSPAMLAIAQAKIAQLPPDQQKRLTIHQGDMTQLELAQQFALVIIPYNTFLHLTPDQKRVALRQINRHLAPNGQLVIDLPHPLDMADTPNDRMVTLEQIFTDPTTGEQVMQFASNRVDHMAQRLDITWFYDKVPASGGTVTRLVSQFSYHYCYPHELEQMLESTNSDMPIRLQKLYGNYDLAPFTEDSPRLLLLAQKSLSH